MNLKDDLLRKKARLEAYYDKEMKMLTDGVQAYGIGSRNIQRYNMDLANIQNQIKILEQEVSALERQANGRSANIRYGFVPRDI